MVTNIIPFRRPDKNITSEALGTQTRQCFLDLRDQKQEPAQDDVAVYYVMENFAHYSTIMDMDVIYWNYIDFDFKVEDSADDRPSNTLSIVIESLVRTELIPEFGHNGNRTIVKIDSKRIHASPIKQQAIPVNIIDELVAYWNSFPSVVPGQRIHFQGAFLATLIQCPGLTYLSHGVDDNRFVARFINNVSQEIVHEVTYVADFLPILLDASAYQLATEEAS